MSISNRYNNTCSSCCEAIPYELDCPPFKNDHKKKDKIIRCNNLVQDPSFEGQSFQWISSNVSFTNSTVFEGVVQATLGPGIASLSQELSLQGVGLRPLFFSFNAVSNLPPDTGSEYAGILIAEVIWLDKDFNNIGSGLRMFIPGDRINNIARITFFAQTDPPPANATHAKIVFSKGQGLSEGNTDFISIDGVVLAPMACLDLLKNGDFEANLLEWRAVPGNNTAFLSSYKESLEGAGHVQTHFNGSLTQDIDVRPFPPGTSFLLSFAVQGMGPVTLNVRLEWLDAGGNPIGSGLNLSIPNETLANQGNYLSYINVSFPTLPGTATARLTFAAVVPSPTNFLRLDQVILAPVLTTNLITNPSFENGLNNWQHNLVTLVQRNDVYEGRADAGLGEIGGALWQDVELRHAEGHCFLFSTGLGFRQTSPTATFGSMIMKVIWLDKNDREIGLGLCLISTRQPSGSDFLEWVPYVGITEPAPKGTTKARVLFSKTDSTRGFIEVDNVVLTRLI
ncbi:MAG: hypothetical protein GX363_00345 [Clostridiales bacterium]|jgi:hypothetical protein|nr:hypothetical protein [Clostridiales bacterium]